MATVRCPSCHRAPNLPEAIDVVTAQCPLCQTTFDATAQLSPPRAVPLATPLARPVRTGEEAPPVPFEFDRAAPDPLLGDNRRALASASGWLKAAGLAGLFHSMLCWCGSFATLGHRVGDSLPAACCMGYILQLVACLLVYNGSAALGTRWSGGTARRAGVACFVGVFLESAFLFLPVAALIEVFSTPKHPEAFLLVFVVALRLGLIALFLTAGIKTMLVLQRPGVRQAFPR